MTYAGVTAGRTVPRRALSASRVATTSAVADSSGLPGESLLASVGSPYDLLRRGLCRSTASVYNDDIIAITVTSAIHR